jgi:hypothetical protein
MLIILMEALPEVRELPTEVPFQQLCLSDVPMDSA